MEQGASKVRLLAIAATVVALLVIAIPFVWQAPHDDAGEAASAAGAAGAGGATAPGVAPVASHDDAARAADAMIEEADSVACMADAKPAKLDYEIPDLSGTKVRLDSFKGKVILLNFWATWCGPCKAEIPAFVELQDEYKDDLVVLGFSVDDPVDKAKAFAAEYRINYPVLLGLGYEEVQDAYGPIYGIPSTFLISRDGKVCKKHMGIAPKAVFEREIKALL